MYNKIFTKILDSSIWLEPDATRIVWITMIAAMDEAGLCQFASVMNLARRANVTRKAAEEAVKVLENPDSNSSDPEHEGRRIERVSGGWIVLNAEKYREIVNNSVAQEANRRRVRRFREKKRLTDECNGSVMPTNENVTISEAETIASLTLESVTVPEQAEIIPKIPQPTTEEIYKAYPRKVAKKDALKAIEKVIREIRPTHDSAWLLVRVEQYAKQRAGEDPDYTPHPATWFNRGSYEDDSLEPPRKREVIPWEQYNEETGLHFDPEKNAWFDKNGMVDAE